MLEGEILNLCTDTAPDTLAMWAEPPQVAAQECVVHGALAAARQ